MKGETELEKKKEHHEIISVRTEKCEEGVIYMSFLILFTFLETSFHVWKFFSMTIFLQQVK